MAYSNDFRQQVLKQLSSGKTYRQLANEYNISTRTIQNWRDKPNRKVRTSYPSKIDLNKLKPLQNPKKSSKFPPTKNLEDFSMSSFFYQSAQTLLNQYTDRFPLLKITQLLDWQTIEYTLASKKVAYLKPLQNI